MLLFVFDRLFLLRFADRQFDALLFQLPPRSTRLEPLWPLALIGGQPRPPETRCCSDPAYPRSSARSRHSGFSSSIRFNFHARFHFLICFSRMMAEDISAWNSQ